MALKGTTRIELTNVKTGQKEVIEKDNLVTNAVPSILDNPFAWQLKASYGSYNFGGNILPLCPKLFGGILLYEDAIPESADQLFAQAANKLVGYSSNNANNNTDIMRGSMNLNESGPLESNDGYRFVFDFATSQANGTISSVGLTSQWGGMVGYGSSEWKNTQCPYVFRQEKSGILDPSITLVYAHLIHYAPDTGVATAFYVSDKNTITVTRVQLHTKHWKLTRNLSMCDETQVLDTQFVETEVFAGTETTSPLLYYNFCNAGDGYIWGFEHAANANGNKEGKASINWIKIKVDDLSFEEGTWEIDGQLYKMGRAIAPNDQGYLYGYSGQADSAILDGYLYCFKYDLTGIYKIKLSNITDITFIEHPDKKITIYGANSNYYYFYWATANMTVAGNKICLWDSWINVDAIVKNSYFAGYSMPSKSSLYDGWLDGNGVDTHPFRNAAGRYGIDIGVYTLKYSGRHSTGEGSAGTIYASLLLNSPYLATINNLPTPVQKTADKTMKITYILREES